MTTTSMSEGRSVSVCSEVAGKADPSWKGTPTCGTRGWVLQWR